MASLYQLVMIEEDELSPSPIYYRSRREAEKLARGRNNDPKSRYVWGVLEIEGKLTTFAGPFKLKTAELISQKDDDDRTGD